MPRRSTLSARCPRNTPRPARRTTSIPSQSSVGKLSVRLRTARVLNQSCNRWPRKLRLSSATAANSSSHRKLQCHAPPQVSILLLRLLGSGEHGIASTQTSRECRGIESGKTAWGSPAGIGDLAPSIDTLAVPIARLAPMLLLLSLQGRRGRLRRTLSQFSHTEVSVGGRVK